MRDPHHQKRAKAKAIAAQSEDESSVVDVPMTGSGPGNLRSMTFCASCRTRNSSEWWKAPKGLASAFLCDNCGLNWRKYADLNARPTTREETALNNAVSANNSSSNVAARTRAGDKREGTPLSAPVPKKAKVINRLPLSNIIRGLIFLRPIDYGWSKAYDISFLNSYSPASRGPSAASTRTMFLLLQTRPSRQSLEMSTV